MRKKTKKQPDIDENEAAIAVLEPKTPDEAGADAIPDAEGQQPEPEFDPEAEDELEEPGPEPSQRRKRGRPPKVRQDYGPQSLADVVNSPEANEAWWQDHRLVIYRKDVSKDMKALMKADSGRTWIDRISGPFGGEDFDESYLRAHYGGGLFSVFLQEKAAGNKWPALMDAEYVIEGPRKYTDEEAAAMRRANPAPGAAQAGAGEGRGDLGTVLDLLQRQIERAEAPQAQALASFADTIRTGQQASTEMLMASMRQVIELRGQPNNGGSDKLIEMLMGMVMEQLRAKPPEPQKTGLDQLREMLELQKIVQGLQPKREPGPFDDVAKSLMLKAAETVVPGAGGDAGAAGGGSLIRELVAPLIPQIPALIAGIGAFFAQQQKARRDQLDHEFRLRAALIDRQRGASAGALPAGPVSTPAENQQPQPTEEEMAQQRVQQEEAAKGAAQMELFIDAMTSMYFGAEDPQDAAITLSTGFAAVTNGLRVQLAPYGEWWGNPMVMGHLRNTYPAMRPLLNHPGFPEWIGKVWAEVNSPQQDGEGQEPQPAE